MICEKHYKNQDCGTYVFYQVVSPQTGSCQKRLKVDKLKNQLFNSIKPFDR